ncbi:MAG: FtsX-like permease family protein [Lachnospiraceae bacterium]
MQKILRKRVFRDLKANFWRYFALAVLIILSMYMIVSLVGAAETIIRGVEEHAEENQLEEGEFTTFIPLTEVEKKKLQQQGIILEENFYLDFTGSHADTIRVFQNRNTLNLVELDEGRIAEKEDEVVLEKRYCAKNGLKKGDKVAIGEREFVITGIGSVPDYDAPLKEFSDSTVDSTRFGMAFVIEEAYGKLKESGNSSKSEEYVYAYRLSEGMTDDRLKEELQDMEISIDEIEDEYFREYCRESLKKEMGISEGMAQLFVDSKLVRDTMGLSKLVQFLPAEDNPRIKASSADQIINKSAGLVAGVIVMVLFTYVISVFVAHNIEEESSVIGTLYALGVKRKELLLHYLMLPVLITFFAGIIGMAAGLGRFGIGVQTRDCYEYFSIPQLDIICPPYLFFYALAMPPLASLAVNYLVIRRKLAKPALALIRKETKQIRGKNIRLGNLGFLMRFRIRQIMREARTGFTVVFGMFISLLILMLGVDCYVICENISIENKADTKYEYMYTYKYPEEEVPTGGTACYAKTLKKEIFGYNLDVTVLGIKKDNPYFDAEIKKGKSKGVISSAMAQKYRLKIGDKVILTDEEQEMDYVFEVLDITQYSTGFYVFMDIDSMRELFGVQEDYYNVVFSDRELDIPSGRLYAVTTKSEIAESSDVFVDMMAPMVIMMVVLAALIFGVVMYLMLKVMMDRFAFGISLVKIFGYRKKEIQKLYLNGNFYIVALGALVSLPLSKAAMDAMYPMMISNISCSMNLEFSWQLYAVIYGGVLLLYFFINWFLKRRIEKIPMTEVLKNRE